MVVSDLDRAAVVESDARTSLALHHFPELTQSETFVTRVRAEHQVDPAQAIEARRIDARGAPP